MTNLLLKIAKKLPVWTVFTPSIPGSVEGITIGPIVLVEETARDLFALEVHERTHAIQQYVLLIMVGLGLLFTPLPVWAAVPITVALYGGLWLLPPTRRFLEGQADRVQAAAEAPQVPNVPTPTPEPTPIPDLERLPALTLSERPDNVQRIREFLLIGGTVREAATAMREGRELDQRWDFRIANIIRAAILDLEEVRELDGLLEVGEQKMANIPTASAEQDLTLALLVQAVGNNDLIVDGLNRWARLNRDADVADTIDSIETLRGYPVRDILAGDDPPALTYVVEAGIATIKLI